MDKQILYKNINFAQYYETQKNILLEKGYIIIQETKEYVVLNKENKNEHKNNSR